MRPFRWVPAVISLKRGVKSNYSPRSIHPSARASGMEHYGHRAASPEVAAALPSLKFAATLNNNKRRVKDGFAVRARVPALSGGSPRNKDRSRSTCLNAASFELSPCTRCFFGSLYAGTNTAHTGEGTSGIVPTGVRFPVDRSMPNIEAEFDDILVAIK